MLYHFWVQWGLYSLTCSCSDSRGLPEGWLTLTICSESFLMQIICNSLYQSPLFQYEYDVCCAPLCLAQRDPLGIRLWICSSFLSNRVQKGWKTGAINLGLLLNDFVYSWSVCFLFKPDTAKHRWSWEEAGRKQIPWPESIRICKARMESFEAQNCQACVRSCF